jgi:hypothetical protein
MHRIAVAACVSACLHRVDATRVTLYDPSELLVEGSGASPTPATPDAAGIDAHEVWLRGRPGDVLAFDRDTLRMWQTRYERRCLRCDWRTLQLRLDTPLANVRSIHAVGVANRRGVIPLGLLAGGLLVGAGGGMLAYSEHERAPITGPAVAITVGVTILALEIRARLAHDTVTVVRYRRAQDGRVDLEQNHR